jgi:hypothetical protein
MEIRPLKELGLHTGHGAGVQNATSCFYVILCGHLAWREDDFIPDGVEDDVGYRIHGTIAMSSHKEGTNEAGLPNAGGKYGECLDV